MRGPRDTNFFERAHERRVPPLGHIRRIRQLPPGSCCPRHVRGDAKTVLPPKYKVRTAINRVVPDEMVARQAKKKHEPRDEERA